MPELNADERDVLLSFASRVDRNDPGALNNLGVLYFRKGIYGEAIEQFKAALKIDPKFDLARDNLQYLFNETGQEDPDVSKWKKEVEEDPQNNEALLRLGVSFQNMGRLEKAAEILGEVVGGNPGNYMARIHLGGVLKAQGLFQQALEHYLCAGDKVGNSAVFHTDLGEIYYNLGRTDEAISELRAAIKLDADYWRSHFLLSFAFGDIGHFQDALDESRIASRLNPSFQNTEANLALSDYDREGRGERPSKEIPSLESTSFTLGTAYRERGYFQEAFRELKKALMDMPEKDRVLIEIGKVHIAEGNNDKALLTFLKALQENPENAEAYKLCGCVYHLQEEYKSAATCYLQAFRLNSADADSMNNLGVLLYQVGLLEDAERMFKKGLNLKLYSLELNYNFLTCNLLKEEYMMAENLIQRLEAFVGKSAMLYEKRALLHYKLNRMTLALFDLESALTFDRNHSDALYLKGLVFLREENFKGAIQAILDGSKIRMEYTGFHYCLALGDQIKADPIKVDSRLPVEPEDELIELLQAGIVRRFDKIKDALMQVAENGINEILEKRAKENEDLEKALAPAAEQEKKAPENKAVEKAPAPAAEREKRASGVKKPSGGNERNVDLLEEIKFDL
ncbi:MAG: tetratricopeptide repeat protein [Candidatus Krumholzibacteriota bacterium]|nr:tetratricopeptide repeat protein [Candidatus Krumholzibacteriota bacterium]